ncbi:MAG: hypothetical protein JWM32_485 [Verrucomicrobia bacterium]|nr:hypothetical protein [Verrucomicrobiota bacterium]
MSSGIRVIRFARAERQPHPALPGAVVVTRVLLDEQDAATGVIVMRDDTWHYLLPDGAASGLTSVASRQDLEWQVALYHLGPLPAPKSEGSEPPLQLAM